MAVIGSMLDAMLLFMRRNRSQFRADIWGGCGVSEDGVKKVKVLRSNPLPEETPCPASVRERGRYSCQSIRQQHHHQHHLSQLGSPERPVITNLPSVLACVCNVCMCIFI